ncbi:FAD-dependent oxidoreductase [Frigidibacter sp. MR17.14]|uniref:oxidoreductase n=1 Tax=Frigidibacter sp. MR17.14 TaxID=3126509 RepID=UPI003012F4F7
MPQAPAEPGSDRLFQPLTLNGVTVRNRFVLCGHGTGMPKDGTPNRQMIDYYAARARGEVGLIMLGTQQVHPSSPGITGLLCNYDDRIIPGLAEVARAVHAEGGRIFGYLGHMGMATSARPVPLWSASAVHEQKYGEVAHAMTVDEIAEVTRAFADAAERNLRAGLDGIEVHCGHGLLLQQFLSPLTNFRTDAYGGSPENRARFPSEVLAAVRARIGPDVPLGIRISADELVPGGLGIAEMTAITRWLVAAGTLDFVDVSAGSDGDLVSNMLHEPPMGLPPAPYAGLAAQVRAACPGVTVIHATRIHTAAEAAALLARGDADMAGMVRPLIADPELPRKAREGRVDEVTPCVACEQGCFGRLFRGQHISCVGNPTTGRETRWAALGPVVPKRVVVVGAGPSGMEAARIAALRGHAVTLIDARGECGGRMTLARRPEGREEWDRMIRHKAAALDRAGVELRLGRPALAEEIVAMAPDAVLLATGARPGPLRGPGAGTAPILTVDEAIADPARVGARVLVIDAMNRTPGIATAIELARLGRQVEICTEQVHVGTKLVIQNLTLFWKKMVEAGVVMTPAVRPVAFEGGRVQFQHMFSRQPCGSRDYDTIVLADPGVPRDELLAPLQAAGLWVRAIGDAYAPRDIEAAFLDGYEAALSL